MAEPKIIMYVRPGCPDVALARTALRERGIAWNEIDIEADSAAMQQVKEWNNGRSATPTLWIGETMLVEPSAKEIEETLVKEAV